MSELTPYLQEIKDHGRYHGLQVKAVHQIGDFGFVETIHPNGHSIFSVFVDDGGIGRGVDSLDHALLMALAYKYDRQEHKSADAWRYAARVLQMEE